MNNIIYGFDFSKAWEYENGYNITSHPSRFAKFISHWEIYKEIINLPGAIVECGVFKGASIIRFATFREILESSYSRKLIGFDTFSNFPSQNSMDDAKYIDYFETMCGYGMSKNELEQIFSYKGFKNIELVEGNLLETIPIYFEKNYSLKIALLHVDVDVYDATKHCLDNLFDKVVRGGIILLDDYSTAVAGATRAIDEFINQNDNIQIQKYPFYQSPSFIIKK